VIFFHVTYTAHFPLRGSDYRGLLYVYVYVHICTIYLRGYMHLCTYISHILLGFSIGGSQYPPLWKGRGRGGWHWCILRGQFILSLSSQAVSESGSNSHR